MVRQPCHPCDWGSLKEARWQFPVKQGRVWDKIFDSSWAAWGLLHGPAWPRALCQDSRKPCVDSRTKLSHLGS